MRDRMEKLGADIAAVQAASVDAEARFPAETFAALRQAALLGVMVPRGFGGQGASLAEVAELCCCLARFCASSALIYAMHQIQVACLVRHGQASSWHRALLAEMAEKQLLIASATTEEGIGGDVRSSACAVRANGGGFALAKDAPVVSYGQEADLILVTARRDESAPPSDQVVVPLARDQLRLTPTQAWDSLGMRGTCSGGFRLEAQGSAEQILSQSYAEVSAHTMLPTTHILWAAVWLGIASDALRKASQFVHEQARRRLSSPPGALRLAETLNRYHQMRSVVAAAIRRYETAMDDPHDLTSASFAMAMNTVKISCAEAVVRVVEGAMQVVGLAGYRNDDELSLGRHLRDALSAPLMISNDRIYANTASLLPMLRNDAGIFA